MAKVDEDMLSIPPVTSSFLPVATRVLLLTAFSMSALAATKEDCAVLGNIQLSISCQQILSGSNDSPRDKVAVIQQGLNQLDFNAGIVDGMAGQQTLSALQVFYEQSLLPQRSDFSVDTVTDIIDQLSRLKTAKTLFEQSLNALDAGNFTAAADKLETATGLSNLLPVPEGLSENIAARQRAAASLEAAVNATTVTTAGQTDEPDTTAIEEKAATVEPAATASTRQPDIDEQTNAQSVKANATDQQRDAAAAALLEAANGLQLTYQDKMPARDKYYQLLQPSVEALFAPLTRVQDE